MDYYYGKRPNLVGPIMKSTVKKLSTVQKAGNTISDKISDYISNFYEQYIVENKVVVIIIILVVGFLIYRYYEIKQKKLQEEPFSNPQDNPDLIKEIKEYQTRHLQYDDQPVMNPTESTVDQKEHVNYPPDPLPINIPHVGTVYARNIYDDPKDYPALNHTNYDHNNVYSSDSRQYHNGTYNTYENAKDTTVQNPYGWSNNFNTNTGKFVGGMTDANKQVMTDYQGIDDTKNMNLYSSLREGLPLSDCAIEPPYS